MWVVLLVSCVLPSPPEARPSSARASDTGAMDSAQTTDSSRPADSSDTGCINSNPFTGPGFVQALVDEAWFHPDSGGYYAAWTEAYRCDSVEWGLLDVIVAGDSFEGTITYYLPDDGAAFARNRWTDYVPIQGYCWIGHVVDSCPRVYDYCREYLDDDADAVWDPYDNCPGYANPTQDDADGDGTGDVCEGLPIDTGAIAGPPCPPAPRDTGEPPDPIDAETAEPGPDDTARTPDDPGSDDTGEGDPPQGKGCSCAVPPRPDAAWLVGVAWVACGARRPGSGSRATRGREPRGDVHGRSPTKTTSMGDSPDRR